MVAAYWQTHSPSYLAWSKGWDSAATWPSVCISQMNQVNSRVGCGHDDSTPEHFIIGINKNSSGDEIANVNFFYNIAHVEASAYIH